MPSVPENLRPTHSETTSKGMKSMREVKRITFTTSAANSGETLYVHVSKLNENEVFVPGSQAIRFDIDLSGGHANNVLVQNVSRALADRLVVKIGSTIIEETIGYDIYKIFEDLFLPVEKLDNMLPKGIQIDDLCKIRSKSGDKQTLGVDAENKPNEFTAPSIASNLTIGL